MESKMRKLTQENQSFLAIILDLKEKQMEKVNHMNSLVEEIEWLNNQI